jgi:hypothetical protein
MDDRRFDSLARAVAGSGSRRGMLRGLVGAVALAVVGRRTPDAAAQSGYLGPGDACYDDSQCAWSDTTALYCDENGFDYDGPRNCCAYYGGVCFADEGCCGSLFCTGNSCGYGEQVPGSWLSLGSQCSYGWQCLGFGSGVNCASNGGFVPACCLMDGERCSSDFDCCDPDLCIAGFCQNPRNV